MLIDVNKWIDKNGSFDEAGGLDLVRHGYECVHGTVWTYCIPYGGNEDLL